MENMIPVTFKEIKRINKVFQGEIWMAHLGLKEDSAHGDKYPVIVLQNDSENKYRTSTIVVPLISCLKIMLPIFSDSGTQFSLKSVSDALMEQITTINQSQLINKIGTFDNHDFDAVKKAVIDF